MYWLKDLLKHIWDYHRPSWAESALEGWYTVAEEVGHPALLRFARRLQKYSHGIVSHCRHRMGTEIWSNVVDGVMIRRLLF